MKGHATRSFSAIAAVFALVISLGCQKSPTRVLTFRIDRTAKDADPNVTSEQVASIIESNLNRLGIGVGTVKALDKDRILMTMYTKDLEYLDEIKENMTVRGRVDLRILASPIANGHRMVIGDATKSSADEIVSEDGTSARWIKVTPRIVDAYISQAGVTRKNPDGSTSILTIMGPFDIHNEHFRHAVPTADSNDEAAVSFEMTDQGALLLEQLTSGHLPDPINNNHFLLGIILNDELVSAPNINDTIKNKGLITGVTAKQVYQLDAILNAGQMPAALVLENEAKP